jgi:DNA ligase (NAD+)
MTVDEKQAAKRLAQLRDEIRKHDRLYYEEAAPIISDREYDRVYKELVDLETQFPDLVTPVTSFRASLASHPDAQPR